MFDLDYVTDAGKAVYRSLSHSRPVELNYTPDNMTSYPLLFVPVGAGTAEVDSAADWMDNGRRLSVFRDQFSYVEQAEGWTVVSWLGHGAWLFRLHGDPALVAPAASFLAEKLGGSLGDGDALQLLCAAILVRQPGAKNALAPARPEEETNVIELRRPFGPNALIIDGQRIPLGPSLVVRGHSPTGFSWGYGGSGPAQTALAILLHVVGRPLAERWYQEFKNEYVASCSQEDDHEIELDVAAWVESHERQVAELQSV